MLSENKRIYNEICWGSIVYICSQYLKTSLSIWKEMDGKIKKHKSLWVNSELGFAIFGKFKLGSEEDTISIERTIDEFSFYCLYLSIANITLDEQLSETQIIVLATLMCKSNDFTLTIDGKGNRLVDLYKEIGRLSKNTIGAALKKLIEKKYLIENEDKMLVLCAKLQNVRGVVKTQIKTDGVAQFDYLFKCFVS